MKEGLFANTSSLSFKGGENSSEKKVYFVIVLYFLFCCLLAPYNLLFFDSYYYWDWSRHLALSYYDGSPMIAYMIKLATLVFGTNLFALNSVGIITTGLCAWILYKTAALYLSREASLITLCLWLFSPLVTLDLLKQVTYNNPLTLFWVLSLYNVLKFIKYERKRELYALGLSLGLMMLSKYSGFVLVLGLMIFLLASPYRYLFKSRDFYLLILLSFAIFSPVLIWNYQHDWLSFSYQLNYHQLLPEISPSVNLLASFLLIFLPGLNFMLLPAFFVWFTQRSYLFSQLTQGTEAEIKAKRAKALCRIISTTFLCFYLFTATKAFIRETWLSPYLLTATLLAGFCYEAYPFLRQAQTLLIGIYAVISGGILLNNIYQAPFFKAEKHVYYELIQDFNARNPKLPAKVFTSGWSEARMLFFLKGKPMVYTLSCDKMQNQYGLWSEEQQKNISQEKEILFIDKQDEAACLKTYFSQCQRLQTKTSFFHDKTYELFAYTCTNS